MKPILILTLIIKTHIKTWFKNAKKLASRLWGRMEGSDKYKSNRSIGLGSIRGSSSSRTGIDVFSKSSREENDEEALKWAALEKLPTFDRLKKGLLFGSTGPNEIDIDNLGVPERKRLLDRLVNAADEDNEKFLLKLRKRIDR